MDNSKLFLAIGIVAVVFIVVVIFIIIVLKKISESLKNGGILMASFKYGTKERS